MLKKYTPKAIEFMSNAISEIYSDFDGRAILLFSGGRDSTAIVASYCLCFPNSQLILLTFDNGLSSYLDSAIRQVDYLKEKYPNNSFVHKIISCKRLMKNAVISEIENDFLKYGFSSLLTCVGCKLIMNYLMLDVAKEMEIKIVMDGFSVRQNHYPEQTEEFMEFIKNFFINNGISYISPLYSLFTSNDQILEFLRECKILIPEQQPICIIGGTYSKAKTDQVKKYLEKCLKIIKILKTKEI